ncbi:winged helix-turn-helix domain-containing protein [Eubacterium aggregans]|uniref:winged helix-turn-helix domain-containing protein n=1 Tax=Eubacterium aggregans TaxID=81409 RepID=UPI003F3D9791
MTPNEFKLITLLARHAGKVLTTAAIIEAIWGRGYCEDTQALRAFMAGVCTVRLKRILESRPILKLKWVWGIGCWTNKRHRLHTILTR